MLVPPVEVQSVQLRSYSVIVLHWLQMLKVMKSGHRQPVAIAGHVKFTAATRPTRPFMTDDCHESRAVEDPTAAMRSASPVLSPVP